jgi:hypothetical protein
MQRSECRGFGISAFVEAPDRTAFIRNDNLALALTSGVLSVRIGGKHCDES